METLTTITTIAFGLLGTVSLYGIFTDSAKAVKASKVSMTDEEIQEMVSANIAWCKSDVNARRIEQVKEWTRLGLIK